MSAVPALAPSPDPNAPFDQDVSCNAVDTAVLAPHLTALPTPLVNIFCAPILDNIFAVEPAKPFGISVAAIVAILPLVVIAVEIPLVNMNDATVPAREDTCLPIPTKFNDPSCLVNPLSTTKSLLPSIVEFSQDCSPAYIEESVSPNFPPSIISATAPTTNVPKSITPVKNRPIDLRNSPVNSPITESLETILFNEPSLL